ncbi:helix-turn-helix domain-containing protein [Dermacoccus abyssi]|uniref:helix-turn-helix domain-containing protein n=1 Tax=Dermacoccus abyssi TaxID=322596 RepID=UPI0021A8AB59|nr:helix-turn-helix domain-containing protein [Dermacoccus abyssi]MCT1985584.1 helix-turn-helix domain-containing protein [Dermacoccus abyssi]
MEKTESAVVATRQFGVNLKTVRTSIGLTQAQLAEAVGDLGVRLTHVMIAKIEGGTRPTTVPELAALAEALRVPLSRLVPGVMGNDEMSNLEADLVMNKARTLTNLDIIEHVEDEIMQLRANHEELLSTLERRAAALRD